VEGRNILQMDQTAPSDKSLLWTIRECRQITNLDRDKRISAHCDSQKEIEPDNEPLHNFTSDKRLYFREIAHFTGFSGH
jgi:hypothetical protein